MSQTSLFTETPRDALLRQLEVCSIHHRDGWYEIVHLPTGQRVPGARIDFYHPTLRTNTPYRPIRFRTKQEANGSLAQLRRDIASGLVIVETP